MACALIEGAEDAWRPQPGVINTQMIRQSVSQMLKDGVTANNIDEDEGYELSELKHLYLEHLDISRIQHLWIMPRLQVLKLTGNSIEKIENLETLVELVDLNLSFNKISVIANLDKLVKLRHLSLYSNKITEVENLHHLQELKILTIGENQISNKKCILYLRKLNLFSLNLAGNPCTSIKNFRFFVATYLPTLQYYEYKNISDDERLVGRDMNQADLELLEREEMTAAKEAEAAETAAAKDRLHCQAFVQGLDGDQLCDAIMATDPAGEALLLIGEDVVEIYHQFREEIGKATTEIFNLGLDQLELRNKEIEMYNDSAKSAILASREKQRIMMENLLEAKNEAFIEINEFLANANIISDEEVRKSIEDEVDKTNLVYQSVKRELLSMELILSEQLKEIFSLFERSLGDLVNSFIEASQGFFTTMREHETVFSEQLGDQASRFLTQITVRNEDVSTLPQLLRPYMVDKEAVNQAVAASHDIHLQAIDSREDVLINSTRGWYQKLCHDLEEEETERFRDRIAEIISFLELQASDLHTYTHTVDEDNYIDVFPDTTE